MTTILVTGANRGIGLEFVRQYAEEASVIACCREPAEAKDLNALARSKNVRVMTLDVGDASSAASLARALKGEAVDILINNAGVFGPEKQSAAHSDYNGFAQTFRINSIGPLIVSQALHDNLLAGRDKKLVTITSKMGSISDSSGGSLAYRASKAAVNMIMHVLAHDWAGDGILVAILNPGWVKTDMGGPGAMISPEVSVRGLRQRIAELNEKTSGRFLDYLGKEIAW
ncbi:MAG: SDR family oxidoreductase [Alphaproteobacteria bacterium]|nr:SDR family oxidoreductase [Alphaproteobacteria bacterium]MDE2112260.1 SDR family oxidoreductase [Alphaproteobacteria bacterium]MDE2495510.1 SDR family oxidoreductase [Alphaproteobacteria bacterium]